MSTDTPSPPAPPSPPAQPIVSGKQLALAVYILYLASFFVGITMVIGVIGIAVLVWWFIWTLVRCIKGILALNENKPIANPTSWMFG